ncbi:MAG TPA: asparaginase [Bacteroidia bacterium]|jgi:L-asparaginase|nr:asparaginase [Bacteroidia bacterium]
MAKSTSVLLIYTGGTIGMIQDLKSGQLRPFDFAHLTDQIPELKKFDTRLSAISFDHPIDSSDMTPAIWAKMAQLIEKNYSKYDGFVILHGSDTMAFTASALSFMLENLDKPVILTGSQLPIGIIRTDGKENLITAIEIAAARHKNKPIVREVCIYFEYRLYRGNRTHKFNAEHFQAFQSPNYPVLAEAGVHLRYNIPALLPPPSAKKLKVHLKMDAQIAILKLFPGITKNLVQAILNTKDLRGVILETYGAGNCSTQPWFLETLKKASSKGIIILNISQCNAGSVEQGKYETSAGLNKIGVMSGEDMTTEAAVAKLMFVLANTRKRKEIEKNLKSSLRGEMTV